jgi:hypothetical protein
MKNLMQVFKIITISISMVVLIGAGNAYATLIDSFDTDQYLYTTGTGLISSTDTSGSDYIGSARYMELDVTSNPSSRGATLESTGGELFLDTGSGVETESLIRWDDNGGGLGADLTDGGIDDRFVISIIEVDSSITLGMTITDDLGNTAIYSTTGASAGDLEFLYANFTGDTVDWENIDSIEFWFTGPSSADMTLDFVETGSGIPEPSTMLLLSAGLIGLVAVNMKKIKV